MEHDFGTMLRRVRRKRGLSMEQLAAKAGMAYKTVAYLENGERLPHCYTLVKLCKALNCAPQELVADFPDQDGGDDSFPMGTI